MSERYATHYGQVTGGKVTKAQTGTPQMEIGLLILHRAENGQWVAMPPDYNATMYISLTDAAWPHAEAKLKTLGFNNDWKNPKFSDQVMGEGLELYSYEDTYNNKKTRKWELVRWGDRKENEPVEEDVLLGLSARWNASNAPKIAVPAGRPAPSPKRNAAPASVKTAAVATRSAPPPAASAAVPAAQVSDSDTAVAEWNKDAAWEHYCNTCEQRGIEPGVDNWRKIISNIAKESGKSEPDFGPEQWERVVSLIDIPF